MNKVNSSWEEKTFSSHLVSLMKNCEIALKYDLIITKEEELEDNEIDNGLKSSKEANPIDIRFHNIWQKIRLDYSIEAKNISSSEWEKTNGNKVNASQQQTEYITKGIDRFLTGHFKDKNGCMLGYIVNGKLEDLLSKINTKIVLQKCNSEKIDFTQLLINNHKIYESFHPHRNLKHLFFDYSN
ncbi:MAG: hypothetical protein Q8K02_13500 [Flavobacterium sp.]|nr:hypothetical protein [Flavobacterium sp.]